MLFLLLVFDSMMEAQRGGFFADLLIGSRHELTFYDFSWGLSRFIRVENC